MATVTPTPPTDYTLADLAERFGADMPLRRIVRDPAPGTATVEDVVRLDAHENRLCELIDGTLLEKTMGFIESYLAAQLGALLTRFVTERKLGVTAGEGGMLRLHPEQVRTPDVSYVSWESLGGVDLESVAAPLMTPDLAVEVLRRGNTAREMEAKLHEYFEAGVRLVWYVDPRAKTVTVYESAERSTVLGEADTLTGGDVLPGLEVDLRSLFAPPKAPPSGEPPR